MWYGGAKHVSSTEQVDQAVEGKSEHGLCRRSKTIHAVYPWLIVHYYTTRNSGSLQPHDTGYNASRPQQLCVLAILFMTPIKDELFGPLTVTGDP